MGALSYREVRHWRRSCKIHFMRRAESRGYPMTADEFAKLNKSIETLRPAFERPGRVRYRLRVRRGTGTRMRVVYDTALQTVVTVLTWRIK